MLRVSAGAITLIAMCIFRFANASELAEIYLSPEFWREMDWERAESSSLWKMGGWNYRGTTTKRSTYVKDREFMLLGYRFEATLGYWHDRAPDGHITTLDAMGLDRAGCDAIVNGFSARFGKPIASDETIAVPRSTNGFVREIELLYQWNFGNTAVMAKCYGRDVEDGSRRKPDRTLTWSMLIGHRAHLREAIPRFLLKCARTFIDLNDMRSSRPDLEAWVSLYDPHVANRDFVVISDQDSVYADNDRLRFNLAEGQFLIQYLIERASGFLTAIVFTRDTYVGHLFGVCELTDGLRGVR